MNAGQTVTSIEFPGTDVEPVFEKETLKVDVDPTGIVLGTKFAPVTAGSANCANADTDAIAASTATAAPKLFLTMVCVSRAEVAAE